jgi:hypothetical protein
MYEDNGFAEYISDLYRDRTTHFVPGKRVDAFDELGGVFRFVDEGSIEV